LQSVDPVDEFLVDGRLLGLVAAWWLILTAAPDVCQLRYVRGSVDVRVLLIGVLTDPGVR